MNRTIHARRAAPRPATAAAAALLAIAAALAGCARSNEGAVDLRRTAMSAKAAERARDVSDQQKRPVRCEDFADLLAAPPAAPASAGDYDSPCLLPLSVKNFSLGADQPFVPGDHLQITLRSAFIKKFWEITNPLYGKKNGEIAIVANAFEMQTGKEINFRPGDFKSGRVVFFSDDVEPGQFLNLNNLPLYGPKNYAGSSVAIRVTIFELDTGGEQMKGLLKSLAALGSLAYAPAAPALALLNSLGAALVSGDQDDTEFRYTMMLDPRRGTPRVNNFALEAGNYVLIRTEKRGEDPPWERLYLNENEGRLYFKPGASDPKDAKPRPYKDETYLVLAINKNTGEKDLDLDENTFGALLESLKNEDRARAQEQALVFNALQEALVERVQTADFGKAKRLLLDVRDAPSDGAARIALGRALDIVARCPAPGAARPKATKATDVALTDDQCDYLLRALSGTGNPDDIKAAVRDRARLTDVLIRSIRDQLKGTL